MKLYIRAHDLKIFGEEQIADKLDELALDGVQLVAYKCLSDVKYVPNAVTSARAEKFAGVMAAHRKEIALIGAYFNPVHSNPQKVADCFDIFCDYLKVAKSFGCDIVGSETGSYNDDKWTYNPQNRTDAALNKVVGTFSALCDVAAKNGVSVGMEGAFGHVCYDVDRLKFAVDKMRKDNVRIIFDLYNYLDISNVDDRYEILKHGLKTFGDRICVFHIKDCRVQDGKLVQCGVGKGIFDYNRILSEIARVNPDAKLVFEGTVGEDIPYAVGFIKDKIKRLND